MKQEEISTRRNINNLRYADDTTLVAESDEGLKSLLVEMKEESEKAGLKLNIQKQRSKKKKKKKKTKNPHKDHSIWPHHFMANRWGNSGNSDRLYFGGLQNHYRW